MDLLNKKGYDLEKYFIKRTKNHILLVRKYLTKFLASSLQDIYKGIILKEMKEHDLSKFEEPEHTPYLLITVKYRDALLNEDFTQEQLQLMQLATIHHVKVNKHHPEYWTLQNDNMINLINRDEPMTLIDATKMPPSYVACMVADWMATSEERNTNPWDWAMKNINHRWLFVSTQIDLIYDILTKFWRKG